MTTDEADAAAESLRTARAGFRAAGDISHIAEHLSSFAGGALSPEQLGRVTELETSSELLGDIGIRILWLQPVLGAHQTLQRRTEAVLTLIRAELERG